MRDRQPARPAILAVVWLLVALGTTSCLSVRPPRSCPLPCGGQQLGRATEVWVYTWDDELLALRDVAVLEDDGGRWLTGQAVRADGRVVGPMRVHDDDICAVRTRRVEPKRVATNVVLAPAVFIAMLALDYWHVDDVEERPEDEPWPMECRL